MLKEMKQTTYLSIIIIQTIIFFFRHRYCHILKVLSSREQEIDKNKAKRLPANHCYANYDLCMHNIVASNPAAGRKLRQFRIYTLSPTMFPHIIIITEL